MLFTDRQFISAESLMNIDGELAKVASAQSPAIDIGNTQKSVIWHYILAAGEEFLSRIQNFSGYLVGVGVNSNHAAAVMNILSTAINRPRALLSQIPVEEPDPTRRAFRRWIEYRVLYDFYRNLFRRLLNDRFERKMEMYREEEKSHWRVLKGRGFPVVLNPLAAPGAIWTYGSGTWGEANVAAVSGGADPASGPYDVSITYCSLPGYASYANQNGAESAGSVPQAIGVGDSQVIQVNLNNLNPPTGEPPNAIGTASGIYPPMNATNWNVYCGNSGGPLYLQNGTPIPIANKTYTFAGAPLLSGSPLNAGQPSQYDFSLPDGITWRA